MRILFVLIALFISFSSIANLDFIDFNKISKSNQKEIDYLIENLEYYQSWTPEWNYEKSREKFVDELETIYRKLSSSEDKNLELYLLLGDIAHFIYNLDEQSYHEVASSNYKTAISIAPEDFRPKWFLANHYALSSHQAESIKYYLEAQVLLPQNEPFQFWDGYIFATAAANMPSHCIYAMDRSKLLTGKPSYFEEQLGQSIYDRILPVHSDSTYNFREIWTGASGELVDFVSRPLGMRVLIDSTWRINFYNYNSTGTRQAFITMVPPAIRNDKGRDITYTIALIAKVAKDDETLEGFVDGLTSKFQSRQHYQIQMDYDKSISYELKDSIMYKDIGGAHMHVIGIERDRPNYAGMLLEKPFEVPNGDSNEVSYYRAGRLQDRFDGRILYVAMLDTCEDIYDEALNVFMTVFSNQLTLE